MWSPSVPISELAGKTLVGVEGMEKGSETVRFVASDGSRFEMRYEQDCCASCSIEDVCGDVSDLIGSPIVRAEEPSSLDGFEEKGEQYDESFTWTFYILGTAKGTLTIRWYGSSNGYYSETPRFVRLS